MALTTASATRHRIVIRRTRWFTTNGDTWVTLNGCLTKAHFATDAIPSLFYTVLDRGSPGHLPDAVSDTVKIYPLVQGTGLTRPSTNQLHFNNLPYEHALWMIAQKSFQNKHKPLIYKKYFFQIIPTRLSTGQWKPLCSKASGPGAGG